MRETHNGEALRQLDQLFRYGIAAPGDRVLLGRFLAERNEAAFEALVERHGPMVLGVCRRLSASVHDADDAFQATFLILVRKAAQLRDPERLGPWLYGVATRVATKARSRRPRFEPLVDVLASAEPVTEGSDLRPVLDSELGRLPTRHREVLVLCVLEGVTAEEAAQRLGCPVGTVKSRLARGREKLRARLVRRGIAPALAALWSVEPSPVSASLMRATLAMTSSAAVAPGVAALTKGVIPSMVAKSTLAASLVVGGVAFAGLWALNGTQPTLAQNPGAGPRTRPRTDQDAMNHMKQILLAFHNFQDVNGHFPAAALYGADGLPKLSWRVAVLPYLGENELYNQFRLDEAWDSPHNKALIDRMPAVFGTPQSPAPAGETRIRGVAGKGAAFEGTQGNRLPDFTDGLSNTLLLLVARDASPWTKPEELPFGPGKPLPALDDSDPQGTLIGLCDGSVRRIPGSDATLLTQLITRNGQEIIAWPADAPEPIGENRPQPGTPKGAPTLTIPGTQPGPGKMAKTKASTKGKMPTGMMPGMLPGMMPMMGAGGPTPPDDVRALEKRLRRVEDSLESIIKRLDKTFPVDGSGPVDRPRRLPSTNLPKDDGGAPPPRQDGADDRGGQRPKAS